MKYLKRFNEDRKVGSLKKTGLGPMSTKDMDDKVDNIKDICLELTDEGFVCDITRIDTQIEIIIHKTNVKLGDALYASALKEFRYEEVKEVVERIKDYVSPLEVKRTLILLTTGWCNLEDYITHGEMDVTSIKGVRIIIWTHKLY
jgi:hypothetical protein